MSATPVGSYMVTQQTLKKKTLSWQTIDFRFLKRGQHKNISPYHYELEELCNLVSPYQTELFKTSSADEASRSPPPRGSLAAAPPPPPPPGKIRELATCVSRCNRHRTKRQSTTRQQRSGLAASHGVRGPDGSGPNTNHFYDIKPLPAEIK